jgi:hypothetical protein
MSYFAHRRSAIGGIASFHVAKGSRIYNLTFGRANYLIKTTIFA